MFRTAERDVHVCDAGSEWERRHVLFRDWLRQSSADRATYGSLKVRLAGQTWASMDDYADAKAGLVAEIMARAEAWAATTRWAP